MKPAVVWIHFNRLNAKKHDGDVWTIRQHQQDRHARSVEIRVPVKTVYRGLSASQPRAYLRGIGTVEIEKGHAVIR